MSKYQILDPEHHAALIADLNGFAKSAGITPEWIDRPLGKTVKSADIKEWLVKFRQLSKTGLIIENTSGMDSSDLASAMAGALVRNFIDANVMTQTEFTTLSKDSGQRWPSCTIVPNFYLSGVDDQIPSWLLSYIMDGLISIHTKGRKVVLIVDDFKKMSKAYGPAMREHVDNAFIKMEV